MATVTDLIPHRAPFLLVDRVLEADSRRLRAERRLTVGDPLLADGLPETLAVEALAQAAACLMGERRGPHRGYLVAASGFVFDGRAQAGETLTVEVERIAALGALHRFHGEARAGERVIARGELTFAVEAAP
jgi:3-hydroxyacyl-[acyl-carrier-protein] dehydratase